jgi:ankyrin repeat protein
MTHIHFAAHHGHTKVAKLLLDHSADINAKNGWDYTPLHLADVCDAQTSEKSAYSMAKLLLEREVDVNSEGFLHSTPLGSAVGRADIVQMLLDAGAHHDSEEGPSHFGRAASQGNTALVQILLDAGFG